jgi:hypothetical protein
MCSPASPHAIGAAKSWVRHLTDGTVYVEIDDAVRPVGPVLEPVAARVIASAIGAAAVCVL